ncbi:amidophosphoribosyltransferase [Patescibacteria group bacterium]|nr:amidophosphoribosyltransferase [Patescibacteria group bacterium]
MSGLFGIYGHPDAKGLIGRGMFALQHRGDDSAGIAISNGKKLIVHKGFGPVKLVLSKEKTKTFHGNMALGQVQDGFCGIEEIEPVYVSHLGQEIAIVFNGGFKNADVLRKSLWKKGTIFRTNSEAEIILHLLAQTREKDLSKALVKVLSRQVEGGYSLILMTQDKMIAVRDQAGIRPLCSGRLNESYVFASETSALKTIGATRIKKIIPGQIITVSQKGQENYAINSNHKAKLSHCIFELIYYSLPSSIFANEEVSVFQRRAGIKLAQESFIPPADLIMSTPDSANFNALGFSKQAGIPIDIGLIRNHATQPGEMLKDKFSITESVVRGKRIILVDDSFVQGFTMRTIIAMLRKAGAKEIHLRIASPPVIKSSCYCGVQFPSQKKLIASTKTAEEIREFIGADTLKFLSIGGLLSCVKCPNDFCIACFAGDHSIIP